MCCCVPLACYNEVIDLKEKIMTASVDLTDLRHHFSECFPPRPDSALALLEGHRDYSFEAFWAAPGKSGSGSMLNDAMRVHALRAITFFMDRCSDPDLIASVLAAEETTPPHPPLPLLTLWDRMERDRISAEKSSYSRLTEDATKESPSTVMFLRMFDISGPEVLHRFDAEGDRPGEGFLRMARPYPAIHARMLEVVRPPRPSPDRWLDVFSVDALDTFLTSGLSLDDMIPNAPAPMPAAEWLLLSTSPENTYNSSKRTIRLNEIARAHLSAQPGGPERIAELVAAKSVWGIHCVSPDKRATKGYVLKVESADRAGLRDWFGVTAIEKGLHRRPDLASDILFKTKFFNRLADAKIPNTLGLTMAGRSFFLNQSGPLNQKIFTAGDLPSGFESTGAWAVERDASAALKAAQAEPISRRGVSRTLAKDSFWVHVAAKADFWWGPAAEQLRWARELADTARRFILNPANVSLTDLDRLRRQGEVSWSHPDTLVGIEPALHATLAAVSILVARPLSDVASTKTNYANQKNMWSEWRPTHLGSLNPSSNMPIEAPPADAWTNELVDLIQTHERVLTAANGAPPHLKTTTNSSSATLDLTMWRMAAERARLTFAAAASGKAAAATLRAF